MLNVYAIRKLGGGIVERGGRMAVYADRELAEKELHSMPDILTDYDHYEIVAIKVISLVNECIFGK